MWAYKKRDDGRIAVTLDSNSWNFFCDRTIDLATELPSTEFAIFVTREVEIEGEAIISRTEKARLSAFIDQTIVRCGIRTTLVFGFAAEGPGPQRVGGFSQATWQSQTEREFYDAIRVRFLTGQCGKGSQLSGNEADAAVAAQSFFSVVLTCEKPLKAGPIRYAAEHGGKVLHLPEVERNKLRLKEAIIALHN
jgi:hypothetical protein